VSSSPSAVSAHSDYGLELNVTLALSHGQNQSALVTYKEYTAYVWINQSHCNNSPQWRSTFAAQYLHTVIKMADVAMKGTQRTWSFLMVLFVTSTRAVTA